MLRRLSGRLLKAPASFDLAIAYLAVAASLALLVASAARLSPLPIIPAVLFGVPGVAWILSKGKAPLGGGQLLSEDGLHVIWGLFFLVLAVAIGAFILRVTPYSRPAIVFVLIPTMVCLVAAASLGVSQTWHEYVCLFQVILIGFFLSISQILLYPDVIGRDPWFHQALTTELLQTQALPTGPLFASYVHFPLFHLTMADMSLMTGLPYHFAALLAGTLPIVLVNCVFVYLLAGELFPRRRAVALLAPLLVVIVPMHIYMTYTPIPNGLAVIFMLPSLLLLYRSSSTPSRSTTSLLILLLGALILTHTICALFMAILLFVSWAAFRVHARLAHQPTECFPLLVPILFIVGLIAWWAVDPGQTIRTFLDLLSNRLSIDYFNPGELASLAQPIPPLSSERLLAAATNFLFLYLPLMGMFCMLSRRGTKLTFNLVVLGAVPLALLTFTYVVYVAVAEDRMRYFAALLNGIAMAVTFLILYTGLSQRVGGTEHRAFAVLLLLLGSLSALSIVSPIASTDFQYLSGDLLPAPLSESELVAASTARGAGYAPIRMDHYYSSAQQWTVPGTRDFTLNLYANNFSAAQPGLVLIRESIIHERISLLSYVEIPYYDVDQTLISRGFSKVYDVGTVRGYRGG